VANQGKAKQRKGKAKDNPRRPLVDVRLAKAISHPVRVEIMVEAVKAPISPAEYVARFGGSVTTVAYHFRELKKQDCLEIVDEQQRRGATEHFYAVTKRALLSDEDFAQLPAPLRGGFNASIFSTFMLQGQLALEADTMDSQRNKHVTWTPLKLDKQGFDRIMGMLSEVYEQAGVEQLASEARLDNSGEEPIYTTLGMFGFESPAPDRDHTPPPR
jgi:DNA-binding transcriptional ArsR family regulator